jgi:hypothetical protein
MLRSRCPAFLVFSLSVAALAPRGLAQEEERGRPPVEIPDFSNLDEILFEPKFTVSLSLRYVGRVQASFGGLGTIASSSEPGDLISDVTRTYDNGTVGTDTRLDGDGNRIAPDGRTNSWSFRHASQITADESSVVFNTYSTVSEGATAAARSNPGVGADVEFAREFGKFGRLGGVNGDRRVFTWGLLWGFGLNDVNAKARDTIRARLNTLTDTYSLLGAAPPTLTAVDADGDGTSDRDGNGNVITNGYSAPSSTSETVTNADGSSTTYSIDTTVLLANLPDSRTETSEAGAAQIDGIWQIKGAALSLRAGPWMRWQPGERLAVRLSAGGALSLLGMSMRYDERLKLDDPNIVVQENDSSDTQTHAVPGIFGGVDLEWWLTERTGFFGAGYYESYSKNAELSSGGRTGEIKFSGGLGVRAGMTFRF